MTDLSQLSDEEVNVRLAKLRGYEPRRMWRFWYDAERQHGVIKLRTEREAGESRQREIETYKRLWNEEITPSQPEEYDEWDDSAPRYCSSLDECAEIEAGLTEDQRYQFYCVHLPKIAGANLEGFHSLELPKLVSAKPRQRAEALIATLQP